MSKKIKNKEAQEPATFLFKKMWKFAKGHRHLVLTSLLLSTMANIVLLSPPIIFGHFLNEIQKNGFGEHNIALLLLILLGIVLADVGFWFLHGPSRIIENISAFKTELNYRKYLISGTLDLGISWHNDRDSGDIIDKVNKASDGMRRFSSHTFIVVEVLIRALGTTIILMLFNYYIGLFAILLLMIALVLIIRFDKKLIPEYAEINSLQNRISAKIFDALSNITTVKILHVEDSVFESFKKSLWAPFKISKKNFKTTEIKWFTGSIMFSLITILPLASYLWYMYANGLFIEIGVVTTIYLYLSNLISIYFNFAGSYEDIMIDKTRVMNAEPIEEAFNKVKKEKRRKIPLWSKISIKNVVFNYDTKNSDSNHIDGIDFKLNRGEKIALIGESGSGKTTFLKVIHGMYPQATASIGFDSLEGFQTNFSDIKLKTTLVPQEPEAFSASIRENITLGLDYTDDEIFKFTDLSRFTGTIHSLPKNLDSVINEKGVNLSGGQKQRLALARALLFSEDKDVILLDESTSSVDPENEVKIYKNMFEYFEGKTVVASIHKMNLLKYFDRIVIFSGGKIVGNGTFDQLLESNDKFRNDWDEYVKQNEQHVN